MSILTNHSACPILVFHQQRERPLHRRRRQEIHLPQSQQVRFWYFTNNENALFIEGGDRRFTCHRANNRYANNFDYFKGIWAQVRDLNFCRNAFDFFVHRLYTMESAHLCRDTQFKKEQKLICLPHGLKFLKELIENDFSEMQRDGDKFRTAEMGQQYRSYCFDNGIKFSISTLKTQLRKLDLNDRALQFKGKKTRCYVLSVADLSVNFSNFLKDDCFQFDSCLTRTRQPL